MWGSKWGRRIIKTLAIPVLIALGITSSPMVARGQEAQPVKKVETKSHENKKIGIEHFSFKDVAFIANQFEEALNKFDIKEFVKKYNEEFKKEVERRKKDPEKAYPIMELESKLKNLELYGFDFTQPDPFFEDPPIKEMEKYEKLIRDIAEDALDETLRNYPPFKELVDKLQGMKSPSIVYYFGGSKKSKKDEPSELEKVLDEEREREERRERERSLISINKPSKRYIGLTVENLEDPKLVLRFRGFLLDKITLEYTSKDRMQFSIDHKIEEGKLFKLKNPLYIKASIENLKSSQKIEEIDKARVEITYPFNKNSLLKLKFDYDFKKEEFTTSLNYALITF